MAILEPTAIMAAGGFSPSQVAGLLVWTRPESVSLADGARLTAWTNEGSLGGSFTASGTQRPTWAAAQVNGLGAVTFDGAANALDLTLGSSLGNTISLFAAAKPHLSNGYRRLLSAEHYLFLGLLDGFHTSFYGDGSGWGRTDSHTPDGALTLDTWALLGTTNNGTTDASYLNHTALTPRSNAFSAGAAAMTMGATGDHTQQYWNGAVGEVLLYNTVLSTTDRNAVLNYLSARWGTA